MAMQLFPQHPFVCLGSPIQRKRGHQHIHIPTEFSEEKQACYLIPLMLLLLFSGLFILHCTVSTEFLSEKLLIVSSLMQAARKDNFLTY